MYYVFIPCPFNCLIMPDPKHFHEQKFQHFAQCGTVLSQVRWGLNILHLQISSTKMIPTLITRFPSTKTESKPSPCHFLPATSGSTVPFALAWHVGRRWDLGQGQGQGMTVRRHEVPRNNFVWELLPSLAKCWKFLLLIDSLHTLTYYVVHHYIITLALLHYMIMISSAYHTVIMNYLGKSCVLVASQGIICKYMYVRTLYE